MSENAPDSARPPAFRLGCSNFAGFLLMAQYRCNTGDSNFTLFYAYASDTSCLLLYSREAAARCWLKPKEYLQFCYSRLDFLNNAAP